MARSYVERLKVIKEIREAANTTDRLAIPQLVVVGSQSVGKSSVMTASLKNVQALPQDLVMHNIKQPGSRLPPPPRL